MKLYIEDKQFWLDSFSFPEKISTLKKRDQINLMVNLYIDVDNLIGLNGILVASLELAFFNSLENISQTLYCSKSDYYWWCFDSCGLLEKKVYKDKNYYEHNGRNVEKWNVELTVSYKDVFGSNKKDVLERDTKLRKLFNEK